ncbi:MAG: hypothetical protein A3K65_07400 [Euryarchaeota archaeon RBG_16_68_12]|nr:MAG: hypothetical protein A3K65_07400 [Euryarchaeota archaeon RBG_16_68_12]
MVSKPLTLVGENVSATVIDGSGSGDVVSVTADWVNMTGFWVTNSGSVPGDAAIEFTGVRYGRIRGNNVSLNDGIGVYLVASSNNTIENNTLYDNIDPDGAGILLSSSDENLIANNTAIGGADGISLLDSDNNVIAWNNASRNWDYGIALSGSNRNHVENNSMFDNWGRGVRLTASSQNVIGNNTLISNYMGIELQLSSRNVVMDNVLMETWDYGIYLYQSSWDRVSNNTLSGTGLNGVEVLRAGSETIDGNTIQGSGWADIVLDYSEDIVLANNTMDRRGILIGYGGSPMPPPLLAHWNTHEIGTSNTVNGRPVHYWKNATGGTVPLGVGQVILANSTGVTVANHDLDGVVVAVETGFSSWNTITNITGNGNAYGVILARSGNSSLSNLSFANALEFGIFLWYSDGNAVVNGNVSGSGLSGVRLEYSAQNRILAANASYGTGAGIFLRASTGNLVSDGSFMANTGAGGCLTVSSDNNTLSSSFLTDNSGDGLCLSDSSGNAILGNVVAANGGYGVRMSTSSANRVFHNSFLGNAQQAFDDGTNAWDDGYPSGGNFWSDYLGSDNWSGPNQDQPGGDGIGDTPYPIPAASMDRYPLMYPVTTVPGRPSAPRNLAAAPGDRQVTLTWNPPATDGGSPITNYTVYRGTSPGGETPLVEVGPVLVYTDTGLTSGQAYYYKVAARNAIGNGPVSNEATATPITFPGAPQGLVAVGADRQVTLTWSPPVDDGGSPVTNYVVYRGFAPGGEAFLVRLGNVLTHTDTGLTNGLTYYYTVSAENAAGEGPNSTEGSATPWAVPSEPRNLNAVAGSAQVTLTWTAPATDGGSPVTNYRVYRGTSPGGETLLTEIGNVLTYVDSGLTNGRTYYYRVSARSAFGEGPLSSEVQGTPATLPGPPASLVAIAGVRQIALSWLPPAGDGGSPVTGYRIYRGTAPGGETLLVTVGNVLTHPDTGLLDGQTFYYKVAAVNGVGEGAASSEAFATTASRPMEPLDLRATAGDGRVTLRWDMPVWDGGSAITGYRVHRGTAPGAEAPLVLLGVAYTYEDAGRTNGVTYYYKVAAVNGVGEGPLSDEASSTPATVPSMPLSLVAVPGRGEVALTWAAPSSDGGSPVTNYRVYRGTSPGGETFLNDVGSTLAYTDRGLVCGQAYYYRVSATNAAGEGPMSDESSATPVTVPGPPRFLVATAAGRQVTLSWWSPVDDGGSPVTGYRIHRGTAAGGETFLTAVGTLLTYVDASVAVGVTYSYQVSAVNTAGEGQRSAEARATVANPPPVCAIQTPGGDDTVFGTHSITGTAQDPDGTVQRVEVRIDNGAWIAASGTDTWSYGWNTRSASDGVHTVHARAYDGMAYSEEATVTVVVRNAALPPPVETPVWQQAWFWALVVVIGGGAVVAYRLMQKRTRGKEPEE